MPVPQREKLLSWIEFFIWNVLILGGLAVALHVLQEKLPGLAPPSEQQSWWAILAKDLTKEAGTACLVAMFLSFSVEYFNQRHHSKQAEFVRKELDDQREKLREQMNQDLFYTIYKRRIPPEILEQLESQLLRADFVRREHRVTLIFDRRHTTIGDRARIIIQHDYKIYNITDTPRDYAVGATIQIDPRTRDVLSQEYRFRSIAITSFREDGVQYGESIRLNAQSIAAKVSTDLQNLTQTFRQTVKVSPGGYASASVSHEGIYPLDGADVISCMLPGDRLTVTTLVPHEDFEVLVTSMHPTDATLIEGDGDDFTRKSWEIPRAIFPGQGISYQWFPRSGAKHAQPGIVGVTERPHTNGSTANASVPTPDSGLGAANPLTTPSH
jgi:hypothetical protein